MLSELFNFNCPFRHKQVNNNYLSMCFDMWRGEIIIKCKVASCFSAYNEVITYLTEDFAYCDYDPEKCNCIECNNKKCGYHNFEEITKLIIDISIEDIRTCGCIYLQECHDFFFNKWVNKVKELMFMDTLLI